MRTLIISIGSFFITLSSLLWAIDLPMRLQIAILNEQFLSIMLGLALFVVYFSYNFKAKLMDKTNLINYLLAFVGLVTLFYTAFEYKDLLDQISNRPIILTIIGSLVVILVMEGVRRTSGLSVFFIILAFIVYAIFCHLVPGELQGREIPIDNLVQYIGFDPSAVFGSPLKIAATIVIPFIFFGNLLFKIGGGDFFTDLALATTGKSRGGAAKISIIASALFGSISGSAVSNVVTTGVVTIPLMHKGGYSRKDAGAIEAVASTGGQLTPPIMGAAAFLMAEFLEVPYMTVVIAAIIPAILYYLSAFIQVDMIAARDNIKYVDENIPPVKVIIKNGWHLTIPFVVLIYTMFFLQMNAQLSSIYTCASVIVIGLIRTYNGSKFKLQDIIDSFIETGKSISGLLLIVASAGFVIGILNMTGLGFGLTILLLDSVGDNLWLLLIISGLICLVLGMGMPTSGVYVLLAILIAPVLIEFGVHPIAAHMFILYFGMMSMITPPIALAAFAAANISKENNMATGFAAMRTAWVAYIIPFAFVYSTGLIMEGTFFQIITSILESLISIFLISISLVGYYKVRLNMVSRLMFLLLGALCFPVPIIPYYEIKLGLVILSLIFLVIVSRHNKFFLKRSEV